MADKLPEQGRELHRPETTLPGLEDDMLQRMDKWNYPGGSNNQSPRINTDKTAEGQSKDQWTPETKGDMDPSSAVSQEGNVPETIYGQTEQQQKQDDEVVITDDTVVNIIQPRIVEPEICDPCLIDETPELGNGKNEESPKYINETQVDYVETTESYESDESA
ncbi:Hypothetical predicted protein [Pelobates cultripes]|uniref:Uncharacterized protein n=1 Tax=Pelobates cultripes TaxID=61616 RepID=A0AAD1RH85_PELCU|nr:Hypothetical predicted protein [Pelobates cultripes]